ncbi:hypothetical protein NMY22_g1708 [Coprinellus aureogranulatus]|nr:hypothetical protein NMY22_g1708 [Coprinellus aureogranulatus]
MTLTALFRSPFDAFNLHFQTIVTEVVAEIQNLQRVVARLTKENEQLKHENQSLRAHRNQVESGVAALKLELERERKENEELRRRMEEETEQDRMLFKQVDELTLQVQRLEIVEAWREANRLSEIQDANQRTKRNAHYLAEDATDDGGHDQKQANDCDQNYPRFETGSENACDSPDLESMLLPGEDDSDEDFAPQIHQHKAREQKRTTAHGVETDSVKPNHRSIKT